MPSFGEKLKREREKRAVTLEEISATTKIGTRMLQALEEEKFSQLPGGIFNKGFVRAYARCVGLDEDQAVADYLEASGESAPPRIEAAAESERRAPESSPDRSRDLPWGLFAAVLLLVALVLSIWSYRKREHRAPSGTSQSAPSALQNTSPSGGPGIASEASAASSNPDRAQVKPAASPNGQPKTVAPEKTAARQLAPVSDAAVPLQPGEFTVVIQAREDSWVSLTSDGKTILSDMLIAGTQRSIRGRKEVVVRAGNTGAVDFFFNGKKLAVQGDYGEVKTLTFGATGLVPNRPAPPATQ